MNTHCIFSGILLAAVIPAVAPAVSAQENLTNKITIDRVIVPEAKKVSRISTSPAILSPVVSGKRLSFGEYTSPSDLTKMLLYTDPYAWADSLEVTPWRGYASLGYFPLFNLNASAGYRIVDTESTSVNAWLQYNGCDYKGNWSTFSSSAQTSDKYRLNALTVGADITHRPDSLSAFSFEVDYDYTDASRPGYSGDFSTGINRLHTSLGWQSVWRSVAYYADASLGICGFTKDAVLPQGISPAASAVSETAYSLRAGVSGSLSPSSVIGLDGKATLLHYNNANTVALSPSGIPSGEILAGGKVNRGLGSVTPYYSYRTDNALIRLGARFDIGAHTGKTFHVAPDILLDYTTAKIVALYGRLGGGEHLNTLGSLLEFTPFILSDLSYTNSHLPVTAEAGINIGNISGFSFGAFGAFARANEWLMPVGLSAGLAFIPVDMRGWKAGIRMAYTYRTLISARASFEIAPKGYDKGWYEWRDRARTVASLYIEGRPLRPLVLEAGLQIRSSREGAFATGSSLLMFDMEDAFLVSLGGRYEISSALSAFLHVENLLDHHYYVAPGIHAQGIHGLAGINLKF